MSMAFSADLHNALVSMEKGQWAAGKAFFPAQIEGADVLVGTNENPADWFRRCVANYLGGDVQLCAMENNLAVFLVLFGERKRFKSIHCQAFAVVDGTLKDVIDGSNKTVRYCD